MVQNGMNMDKSNGAMMQGAALGSTFGPWGTVIGAGLGAAGLVVIYYLLLFKMTSQ